MPFSKKFRKIMGFPKEKDRIGRFTIESISVNHIHVERSKPRRYEYPVRIIVQGKGNKQDVKATFSQLLSQTNVKTTSGYGNPYSCNIGDMKISSLDAEKYSIEAVGNCTRVSNESLKKHEAVKVEKFKQTALKVFQALFQNQETVDVDGIIHLFSKTSASKIRFVKIEEYTFIEQNPKKDSKWGKMAQKGHKIMWICRGPAYMYRIMDGQFLKLNRKKKSKNR